MFLVVPLIIVVSKPKKGLPSVEFSNSKVSQLWGNLPLILWGMSFLMGLVVLAEPFKPSVKVSHNSYGAQIVLALDRSASMGEPFANGKGSSKADTASEMFEHLILRNLKDQISVIAYSNSAMVATPLTDNKKVVRASLTALKGSVLTKTNVGGALATALDQFKDAPVADARAIIVVTDGASRIPPAFKENLKERFNRYGIGLYWVYLRDVNGLKLDQPTDSYRSEGGGIPSVVEFRDFVQSVHGQVKEVSGISDLVKVVEELDSRAKNAIEWVELKPAESLQRQFSFLAFILSSLYLWTLTRRWEPDHD